MSTQPIRIIVGVTGASGAPFAVRLMQTLQGMDDVETHLVMSGWARSSIGIETSYSVQQVSAMADVTYKLEEQGAAISSGSFQTAGMIVVPCSMRTLAAIRYGLADNLVCRAADVVLKEGRRLVLVPRETPLNTIHLENMLALSRMGARIVPPMPAFYNRPESVDDIVDHVVVRVLDQFGINAPQAKRWQGMKSARTTGFGKNSAILA
ncbi:non-oxidative hydroxyarylic acid decarboxylases subunit B [Mycobacterium avium]|uniref:non-oxidative hydroxyarylic acid decarboxylases subunit B n=1 Tax=Mycobacterium avium TaxID=1764 RepID=UPI0003D20F68|nr:non-oxidative hydroxyarylic acid decarboxylases subunit B [Mycobacterium avium]ETB09562.1 phenolic acid decarboxylase subunit B [Mycobacterium avium subsp. silvaticum ATCC 49884]ETB16420.1 phenolic acid decarboxylase subunit B [Mycobacterium avium subsp. avium 10-9275]ETB20941.1 phenolic acid decarboxylase subunit B [Mycobacterium avium subsp. avium 11-4751]AYJ04780.1 UbiX family flavin prenyltransferase [Mycobacterium avium]MDV3266162.1 UbiX family flavin prenyltransferase [Mycobacterium a